MACRQWRYNDEIPEYYVITDDTTSEKHAETTRHQEETQLNATWSKPHPTKSQLYDESFKSISIPYRVR